MTDPTDERIRERNDRYRDVEPSDLHADAFEQVVATGGVDDDLRGKMVDRLYEPWDDRHKKRGRGPANNDLMIAVERSEYAVKVSFSDKLYHQQPIGVLLRPINEQVRKAGEALVARVNPHTADVEPEVMPHYHYKLTIEPTPVWLAKWIGEDGYPTV